MTAAPPSLHAGHAAAGPADSIVQVAGSTAAFPGFRSAAAGPVGTPAVPVAAVRTGSRLSCFPSSLCGVG